MSIVSQLRGVDGLVTWTEESDQPCNKYVPCVVQLKDGTLKLAKNVLVGWLLEADGVCASEENPVLRWLEVTADIEASMLEILKPVGIIVAVSSNVQTATIKTSDGLREMDFRRRRHDVSERDE